MSIDCTPMSHPIAVTWFAEDGEWGVIADDGEVLGTGPTKCSAICAALSFAFCVGCQ